MSSVVYHRAEERTSVEVNRAKQCIKDLAEDMDHAAPFIHCDFSLISLHISKLLPIHEKYTKYTAGPETQIPTHLSSHHDTPNPPPHILSMTQIPPSLLQPPHKQLPTLLRPYPAQEPMSPLPHQVARVIRITRPASNLHRP